MKNPLVPGIRPIMTKISLIKIDLRRPAFRGAFFCLGDCQTSQSLWAGRSGCVGDIRRNVAQCGESKDGERNALAGFCREYADFIDVLQMNRFAADTFQLGCEHTRQSGIVDPSACRQYGGSR